LKDFIQALSIAAGIVSFIHEPGGAAMMFLAWWAWHVAGQPPPSGDE